MASKKQTPMVYKRDKHKAKISGDPKDTKWLVWFDLVSSRLLEIIIFLLILFIGIPNASIVPVVWQWIKKQLPFMILFVAVVGHRWLLLLSG